VTTSSQMTFGSWIYLWELHYKRKNQLRCRFQNLLIRLLSDQIQSEGVIKFNYEAMKKKYVIFLQEVLFLLLLCVTTTRQTVFKMLFLICCNGHNFTIKESRKQCRPQQIKKYKKDISMRETYLQAVGWTAHLSKSPYYYCITIKIEQIMCKQY